MIYIAIDNYKDGFPLSKAYDDTIYQKGNGEYYLKFRFPVDRLGVWKHLTCETILKADDTRGLQLFKIKKINKINGYIRVYCKHISDDLNYIGVDKLSVTNATGRRVMEALAGSTTEPHNFIFNSDVATMHTLNLSNTTAGKILSKDKHSIIGQWGGELVRDNFLVDLKARAGVDTEILFMNKKNVKNLDNVISTENLTTRLKLSVEKEHEGKKQTITATVDSPNINAYPRIYTNYLKITNTDITTQEELIEYGKKYFRDKLVDFPTDNLTVNVIDKNQEQVRLFDTVWFRNVDFNIDKRLKVVAYEYSPMAKRYKKISFGALKVSNLSQIKSLSQLEDKIEEKVNESFVDAFKIQKNLSELLKLDRKGIEDKLVELEEKSKGALEVKKALFEADGTIPDVVKAKILDAVEGDIGRLKTIITEAELIKAIQAKLNFAEIKNALIDKAFINQIISDEKFTQQFEDGQVTTQNIFTKLKDSIKSNISKEFMTKDGVRKLVNDLTIDADGIRQITQQESQKVFNTSITGKVQEIVGEVKKNLPTKEELKGKSSYLHKKYSDYADGRNMSDNSTLKYIGIYTGDKQQAPTNPSEYSWTKIRGEDGARGRDGNNGRDGVDGKSYARNYLSGTAGEKILTAVNDNFSTQEAFKLVDDKNFRDLGFNIGDKITFIADYEVLPNGTNKKISRLNFEWYDGTRYRAWMNQDINPTKGTYVRTLTVNNDLLDSKRAFLRTDNVNAKIKITNARVIQGETVQPWSIAQEDLRGRDGVSNYIHRKYSDYSNGANMSDNSNLKYIGIYTGTSPTPPTTASSYLWSKIKGEDGANGVPGTKGADGRTPYFHTAYSNSPTGDRDFSTINSNDKLYIGTYSDFEVADSTDYRKYKWVKIKGENGRDGNNGRDGRNGDSYTRNYLSGTAEEKILTAVNDNFVTQEAFKLVDGKAFRDLGFNIGDKITFIADYEVLPNGTNKKISRLNFEWYDDNRYRFWMNQDLNPTKGTFTRTVTVNNDLLDSKRAFLRTDNVNAKIKITNARVIKGDTVQPWSIAQEDLQGHTLTANLWFSGNYINNVTSNVRLNLVVYYDGKEIRDFNANIKYVGGGINDWRTQENVRVLRDNTVDYGFWGNSEKNGTPLFALAIVNYKGLQTISDARLDNVPNVEDVKETIKKFKTFESTLDSFKSVIGEIKSREIKTIVNTPNLCTEDFSNNKSKRGNDLYFNVSPSLKANTKYTVIVDVNLEKVEVHQKTKVYGAKSGGGEQWLKSGRNVWVVDYATEQTRVNIYPLGEFSKVFNVEIYEGDYREFIEQNNRFVSMDTAKREQSGFYSYKINHNINNGKGKYFLVKFDLASLPADKWFASGDNGTLALYSFGAKQFTEELKLKDNEYIFKAHLDDTFYIFHSTNSLNLINVRLYEVRFGVTLATQNSLIDISSMIDQSKEAVTLSARKEIESKLTNYPTNAYLSNNFANKQDLENLVSKSELKVLSDRIESSVNTGNFGTTLSQNAYYVRVAWNSISNYVQFENGGLNFYEGSTTQNNLRARIDDGNYTFWRDGYNLGNMGTGYYAKDNNKKGIQFHLEYDGWFMGWAYKQKRTDNFYTWKWYYTSGSVGDTYSDTLNAGCNTNFRWNEIWYFKTRTSWFNIMDGLNGTISVVSNIENTGDGGIRWWTRNLTFKNGILIGG